jgi:hypothetical protein
VTHSITDKADRFRIQRFGFDGWLMVLAMHDGWLHAASVT